MIGKKKLSKKIVAIRTIGFVVLLNLYRHIGMMPNKNEARRGNIIG